MSISKKVMKLDELRETNHHVMHVTNGPNDFPDGTSIERGKRLNSNKKDLKRKLRTLHNESTDGTYEDIQTSSLIKHQTNSSYA